MRTLLAAALLATSTTAAAAGLPYDELADAKADIHAALTQARSDQTPVLVVFGANWCGDCRMLDMAFKDGTAAPLIAKKFKVVKVDVGRFDRNVDVAETYGLSLKPGIPAVVVLSAEGKVVLFHPRRRAGQCTQDGRQRDLRLLQQGGVDNQVVRAAALAGGRG